VNLAMDKKLLIIDEQLERASRLEFLLRQIGIAERCSDGIGGLVTTLKMNPDIIVASDTVPKLSGEELCEQIRAATPAIILMLSPLPSSKRVAYYAAGADEVIGEDVEAEEIAAKASVWLRRLASVQLSRQEEAGMIQYGALAMNQRTHKVFVDGEELSLTRKEFAILWALVSNQAQIVSRDELIRFVWRYETLGDDRMIDTHLNRIRKKLSAFSHLLAIKTIWGVGYKLEKVKAAPAQQIQSI
jgi:DNA-binding response OmpR family regulator